MGAFLYNRHHWEIKTAPGFPPAEIYIATPIIPKKSGMLRRSRTARLTFPEAESGHPILDGVPRSDSSRIRNNTSSYTTPRRHRVRYLAKAPYGRVGFHISTPSVRRGHGFCKDCTMWQCQSYASFPLSRITYGAQWVSFQWASAPPRMGDSNFPQDCSAPAHRFLIIA